MLASRFNVLKIDDDSDAPSSDEETRRAAGKGGSKANKKDKNRKKTTNQRSETAELRALAFGTGKTKKKGAGSKKSGGALPPEQWNEWKQKDEAIVRETFEDDLAKAILLSKVEYEEKGDKYGQKGEHEDGAKSKKKQKPVKTVSLDAFKQMTPAQVDQLSSGVSVAPVQRPASPKHDKQYFNRLVEETREELRREERRRLVLEHPRVSSSESGIDKGRVSPDSDKGRISPESHASDDGSPEVNEQIATLTTRLEEEKGRVKRLLTIFKDAELKEKAKLIVEAERANRVIGELTTQVTDLHEKLEQERSKVHSMADEIKKLQEQLLRRRTSSENQ